MMNINQLNGYEILNTKLKICDDPIFCIADGFFCNHLLQLKQEGEKYYCKSFLVYLDIVKRPASFDDTCYIKEPVKTEKCKGEYFKKKRKIK